MPIKFRFNLNKFNRLIIVNTIGNIKQIIATNIIPMIFLPYINIINIHISTYMFLFLLPSILLLIPWLQQFQFQISYNHLLMHLQQQLSFVPQNPGGQ